MSIPPPLRLLKRPLAEVLRSPPLHRFFKTRFAPHPRAEIPADIRQAASILILKPDEIGDVVLATGFLASIRRQCPGAKITLLLRPAGADLVRELGVADQILINPDSWGDPGKSGSKVISVIRAALSQWRPGAPDWVLIARPGTDYTGSPYYAAWTGSPNIWAHQVLARDGRRDFSPLCTHIIPRPAWVHQVEDHKRMLRELGLDDSDAEPRLVIPAAARDALARKIDPAFLDGSAIAFGIGAGIAAKRWPVENFAALAQKLLAADPRRRIALIGGESDRSAAEILHALDPVRVLNACGPLTLLESAALLERCALYVGNDTGPMHIAAAVGRPVIEICKHPLTAGPERDHSPVQFGPRAVWSRVLRPKPMAPECVAGCDKPEAHCILGVSINDVLHAIEDIL